MNTNMSFEDKYQIIGTQDIKYEGAFITAVKTTGIFCRPSCRARKPNRENVTFYETVSEAVQNGFRPCKICKPLETLDETPVEIKKLIKELHENPQQRIRDEDLIDRGMKPHQIRRWFNKHHQMTFQSYQRMLRINAAYKQIQKGEKVIDSAFDSGYDSLSGFSESYKSVFGSSALDSKNKRVINIVRFSSPLGPLFACATDQGVCLMDFVDRKILEQEFIDLRKRLGAVILPGENPHLKLLQKEMKEYFAGNRRSFTVPLHTPSTEFREQVWQGLRDIPYGQTRSYKQQAVALGNPNAVRAVAAANGQNRVNIIIPCHRVIGSDGSLTGYGGGLHRKKWLLELEQKTLNSSD